MQKNTMLSEFGRFSWMADIISSRCVHTWERLSTDSSQISGGKACWTAMRFALGVCLAVVMGGLRVLFALWPSLELTCAAAAHALWYWAHVFIAFAISCIRVATQWGLREAPLIPPHDPRIDCPLILIAGNMGDATRAASQLSAQGVCALAPPLGPVSSCHDKACELFYALKGGVVDFGASHSAAHHHLRYFGSATSGLLPEWSASCPVILISHSQGASTARMLVRLLQQQAFEGHDTSASWVRGMVCISAPFNGAALLTSPFGGVPPPTSSVRSPRARACGHTGSGGCAQLKQGEEDGKKEGDTKQACDLTIEQRVGMRAIGASISAGYILHIFLGWSRSFRAHVWDWRVDQWQLGWSDLPALLHYQHRLQRSTDTALFEITEVGAAEFNRLTPPVEGVFYVSLPCQVTQGDDAVPLATNSPTHVLLAAINARWATASQPNHSDGLLSTSSQLYPQYQPHALIAELNPPSPLDKPISLDALRAQSELKRVALRGKLKAGVWSHAEPCPLSHSEAVRSHAPVESVQVSLPIPN
uniref:Lipase-like C-terminal domain-containing protein n=1 Tax=Haptolina ericina TaxID=156174 RepID=A0A7S3BVF3_9EUKA|mmetsp:Transcript_69178/g.154323  ORF Transcript_69178/g.154323 Transcript_69178/m.154323 type:complete len:533 (+) Transcript_69178:97-1695(+)